MPQITFIDEGSFDVTEEVLSRNVLFVFADESEIRLSNVQDVGVSDSVTAEQDIFRPTLTQRVEWDEKGKQSQTTTVCGETVNRREGSNLPEMTIEGIVTEDKIAQMKALKRRSNVTLISDLHKGQVFVKRVTIEQNTDLLYWIENGEKRLAFNFQIQLGEPEE